MIKIDFLFFLELHLSSFAASFFSLHRDHTPCSFISWTGKQPIRTTQRDFFSLFHFDELLEK